MKWNKIGKDWKHTSAINQLKGYFSSKNSNYIRQEKKKQVSFSLKESKRGWDYGCSGTMECYYMKKREVEVTIMHNSFLV